MRTLTAVVCAWALTGCASGGEDPGSKAQEEVAAGTIEGSVSYGGVRSGILKVGLFLQCPPAGPPVDLIRAQVDQPVFPQAFSLKNVKPGLYYVYAYLDVEPYENMPGSGDISGCSGQLFLSATRGAYADIGLVE